MSLWETQLSGDGTAHFLCLKSVRATGLNSVLNQYKDKITKLLREFKQRFQIFGKRLTDFQVFCSPFIVNPSDLSVDFQLEIIDLQSDSDLKTKFALATLDTFYRYFFSGYSKVTSLATKALCMFGTTYLCEQVFFVMNIKQTKLRSRLTHSHLNDILKVLLHKILHLIWYTSESYKCQISGIGLNRWHI